jgi:ABC-type oligopeptide transport system substrate-binding subunit
MKHMKLTTMALASAFALSSTFALAATVHHRPSIRTYDLHKRKSGVRNPTYGNPDGPTTVSAGGYLANGRSASEAGGF